MFRIVSFALVLTLTTLAAGSDEARLAGLSKAADLERRASAADAKKKADAKALREEFVATLQDVAPHLPTVDPEETNKPKTFHKLTLNAGKTRLDAFRFRVPDGAEGWNLDWEFVYPAGAGLTRWYIVAREGTVPGFNYFDVKKNYAEQGADLPAENRRVKQRLHGGKLKPGAEYVIWFAFADDKPVDIRLRIGLTPVRR